MKPLRLSNALGLWISFQLSKITRKPLHWGGPMALSIEPTTACNLGCPECPSGLKSFTRATGKIDLELNEKILDQTASQLTYINYYFQGEPFLHPQFLQLVAAAAKRGIYTHTSTNAHFLNGDKIDQIIDSGLNEITISVDGMRQETYESYRVNGQLNTVIEATARLIAKRNVRKAKHLWIVWQFLVVKTNETEIDELKTKAAQLGVDEIRLKTAQFYHFENGHPLMPTDDQYRRYVRNSDGTYRLKNKMHNHCWRMWSSAVITWDGKMVPCCFDKDAKYAMGNLADNRLTEVWKSEVYRNFRTLLLKDRQSIDICKNCSEGSIVFADQ